MGVPGLWDLIRPAATRSSLSTLSKDAFLANKNDLRALQIGIDASIWIFHAQVPQDGENPFLRTIFYKIATLLQQPVLPVFVFDGPDKPKYKRNARVSGAFGSTDWRSKKFKELLDACGLEWWNAPGEAEAELAIMNRQGKIDAVLSDDVDALLFGATKLLRNNSPTLSGAKASSTQNSSRGDHRTYEVYSMSAIHELWSQQEGTALQTEEQCRMAMVLIALLGGGDYAPEGVNGFGATTTHGLAHAGLADFLSRYNSMERKTFERELRDVHGQMMDELRTNSTGHIGRKNGSKADKLAAKDTLELFPFDALNAYLRPATSPLDDIKQGWPGFGQGEASLRRGKARNEGRGDLAGMARACEKYFEWGTKDIVARKFGSETVGLFSGAVLDEARQRVRRASSSYAQASGLDPSRQVGRLTDFFPQSSPARSTSKNTSAGSSASRIPAPLDPPIPEHILKVHSTRPDPCNPDLIEYRVAFLPDRYIDMCHNAMEGYRIDPKLLSNEDRANLGLVHRQDTEDLDTSTASQAVGPKGKAEHRAWVPEYLIRAAWPELVFAYEESLRLKAEKKNKVAKPRKGLVVVVGDAAERATKTVSRKKKVAVAPASQADTEAFKTFFAARPPATTAKSVRSKPVTTYIEPEEMIETEYDEEVEYIESPRSRIVASSTSRRDGSASPPRSLSPSKRTAISPEKGRKKAAMFVEVVSPPLSPIMATRSDELAAVSTPVDEEFPDSIELVSPVAESPRRPRGRQLGWRKDGSHLSETPSVSPPLSPGKPGRPIGWRKDGSHLTEMLSVSPPPLTPRKPGRQLGWRKDGSHLSPAQESSPAPIPLSPEIPMGCHDDAGQSDETQAISTPSSPRRVGRPFGWRKDGSHLSGTVSPPSSSAVLPRRVGRPVGWQKDGSHMSETQSASPPSSPRKRGRPVGWRKDGSVSPAPPVFSLAETRDEPASSNTVSTGSVSISVTETPRKVRGRPPGSIRASSKPVSTTSTVSQPQSAITEIIDLCLSSSEDEAPTTQDGPVLEAFPLSPDSPQGRPIRRSPRSRRATGATQVDGSPKRPRGRPPNATKLVSPEIEVVRVPSVPPDVMTGPTPKRRPATSTSVLLAALGTPSPPKAKIGRAHTPAGPEASIVKRASKAKTITTVSVKQDQTQTLLDMPAMRAPTKPKTKTPASSRSSADKPKKVEYVVLYDDDDLEILDCRTR